MRKVNDLVLIYYMGKPSVYARIESIEPDIKEGWYQVNLLLLTIPAQSVVWILKEEYIDGATFTMGGVPIRLGDIEIASPLNQLGNMKKGLQQDNKKEKPEKKNIKTKENIAKVISLKNIRDQKKSS